MNNICNLEVSIKDTDENIKLFIEKIKKIKNNKIEKDFFYKDRYFHTEGDKYYYEIEIKDDFGYWEYDETIFISKKAYEKICLESKEARLNEIINRLKKEVDEKIKLKKQLEKLKKSKKYHIIVKMYNGTTFEFLFFANSDEEAKKQLKEKTLEKTKHWKYGSSSYEEIIMFNKI